MNTFRTVTIARIGSHQTVCMAADELKHYLNALDPEALVDVRIYDAYDASLPKLLWVGLDEKLSEKLTKKKLIGLIETVNRGIYTISRNVSLVLLSTWLCGEFRRILWQK